MWRVADFGATPGHCRCAPSGGSGDGRRGLRGVFFGGRQSRRESGAEGYRVSYLLLASLWEAGGGEFLPPFPLLPPIPTVLLLPWPWLATGSSSPPVAGSPASSPGSMAPRPGSVLPAGRGNRPLGRDSSLLYRLWCCTGTWHAAAARCPRRWRGQGCTFLTISHGRICWSCPRCTRSSPAGASSWCRWFWWCGRGLMPGLHAGASSKWILVSHERIWASLRRICSSSPATCGPHRPLVVLCRK